LSSDKHRTRVPELGIEATCPFVAHGENMDEPLEDMKKHAKEVQGYTDEEVQDPKMVAVFMKHAHRAD
jgi:predicted small metal-binding protein